MAHPIYKNSEGKRMASVTTVLANLGWSKGGLMHWAWTEGVEGRDYRSTSKKAMDIGTAVHAAIEAEIKGHEFSLVEISKESIPAILQALEAWKAWKSQSKLRIVASEVSLVSEKYQYAGTLDCCTIHKKRSILDLKTSNGIYPEYLCQVVAYGKLWEENNPMDEIEEYHILRISKQDGSFHHHCYQADKLKKAWEVFLMTVQLHNLHKELKNMV